MYGGTKVRSQCGMRNGHGSGEQRGARMFTPGRRKAGATLWQPQLGDDLLEHQLEGRLFTYDEP